MRQSPHGISYEAHRPVVMGRRGMVASGHPLASQAGIAVMQRGGNAVDAAVAVAAAVSVVEPGMSGIGGDGFIMLYHRARNELNVVNATGAAPGAATREQYLPDGIPMKGILSMSVPGLLRGWVEAHRRYGALSLAQVLEPAIDLAENGFPVSHTLSASIAADTLLCEFPTSRAVFTRDGRPLAPGEVLYQRDLARTFQRSGAEGDGVFYEGEIAQALVRFSEEQGGLLTLQDLAACRARWQDPIATTYRGYTVYEAPPNSSGHVLLQELNLAEQFDLRALGCNTAESIHLMTEAKKLAFADREVYLADPEFVDVPIPGLLSKEYAAERRRLISQQAAMTYPEAGRPAGVSASLPGPRGPQFDESTEVGGTTSFTVADSFGNVISATPTHGGGFGTDVVVGNTGLLFNNGTRIGSTSPYPDDVNYVRGGQIPLLNNSPVIVMRDGEFVLGIGTPGGETIGQTQFQTVLNVLEFGMSIQEAVAAPRFVLTAEPNFYLPGAEIVLNLENRVAPETADALAAMGHNVELAAPYSFGSNQGILRDAATGTMSAGADPRRVGYAVGW